MKSVVLMLLLAAASTGWAQALKIESVVLTSTNHVMQYQPSFGSKDWFILTSTNRWLITLTNDIVVYAGPCVKLSWPTISNRVYSLEYTTNFTTWWDIRVKIHGTGGTREWYDNDQGRTYRLKGLMSAPANLLFQSK